MKPVSAGCVKDAGKASAWRPQTGANRARESGQSHRALPTFRLRQTDPHSLGSLAMVRGSAPYSTPEEVKLQDVPPGLRLDHTEG